jgi:hypothetical protein
MGKKSDNYYFNSSPNPKFKTVKVRCEKKTIKHVKDHRASGTSRTTCEARDTIGGQISCFSKLKSSLVRLSQHSNISINHYKNFTLRPTNLFKWDRRRIGVGLDLVKKLVVSFFEKLPHPVVREFINTCSHVFGDDGERPALQTRLQQ